MNYLIRKKEKKDCKDVAHVVTIAWNETYKGIVPDLFLEELKYNENERVKMSYEKFDVNNNHQFVLEIDNEVVGFVLGYLKMSNLKIVEKFLLYI